MPVTPSYPGVYIEEIPSGVRTITGVATSITAFIGRALRGPTDKAVTINNFGDFERIFGGLWLASTLGYAVRDFYLNGGGQAIIVRLFHPQFSESDLQKAAAAATEVADAAKNATDGAAAKLAANTKKDTINADAGKSPVEKKAASDVATALAAVADAATKPEVAKVADAAVAKAAPRTVAELNVNGLLLQAAGSGSWGNNLRARIDYDVSESVATSVGLAKAELFNLTVRDTRTGLTEQFRNVSLKPSPRQVDKVLENESRLVRVKGALPGSVPTAHSNPTPGQDVFAIDALSSKVATDKQASDGDALEVTDFLKSRADKLGLYALEQADLFNLLCLPPYKIDGNVDANLIDAAISYCEERRAMLLVDPPANWNSKESAKTGIETEVGSASKNAAIFFPRLRQPNPLRDNQVESFAPCGAVAGLFARTDTQRGVWKAPAGLDATLVGVPALSVPLTDAENGELNPKGINCLRAMPAAGRIAWGSRTRVGDDRLASEWKYIPVRRTALFIEESLYRGTQWVVFEPNDEPLWAQIRLNLGAFMQNLFRQGAFQGRTPREAYFVKCDKETTTQTDINLGIVNIVVGFAPLKPAEFVIVKLQQIAGQIAA